MNVLETSSWDLGLNSCCTFLYFSISLHLCVTKRFRVPLQTLQSVIVTGFFVSVRDGRPRDCLVLDLLAAEPPFALALSHMSHVQYADVMSHVTILCKS